MLRRYHALIVVLAVALQVIDGVVGALGHSHGNEHVASGATHEHGSACCHQHAHDAALSDGTNSALPQRERGGNHDDCSLCRHFSQPVAPVALTIELVGSQAVEPVAATLIQRVDSITAAAHPARGPPATSA